MTDILMLICLAACTATFLDVWQTRDALLDGRGTEAWPGTLWLSRVLGWSPLAVVQWAGALQMAAIFGTMWAFAYQPAVNQSIAAALVGFAGVARAWAWYRSRRNLRGA